MVCGAETDASAQETSVGNRSSGVLPPGKASPQACRRFYRLCGCRQTNLAGVFSIPGVNVDQVPRSEEYLVTKFTRLVVIHGSDQNDQFRVGDHLPVFGSDPYT